MVKAHEAGAVICPAIPSFYHKPRTIEELAFHYACRVANLLGFNVPGMKQWKGADV
jgi:4-hydroxy-3-polyprenylbenzoate decarboxylase